MNLDELTIGQGKQLAAMFNDAVAPAIPVALVRDEGICIVVLERGFVYVGKVRTDAEWVYMVQAKNIRKWGTSLGLGELVGGPTRETRLDAVGNIKAPMRALIHLIKCKEDSWNSIL